MASANMTVNNTVIKDFDFIIKEGEFEKTIEDMKEFLSKYPTDSKKKDYIEKMNSIIKIYDSEIEKLIETIKKDIQDKITHHQQMKENIHKIIAGTFKSIDITMDGGISMSIDLFSIENLEKLLKSGKITDDIFKKEMEWRQFKKEYITNDKKQEFIKKIDKEISELKSQIENIINKIHRINLLKNKVIIQKNMAISYEDYDNLHKKYYLNNDIDMDFVPEKVVIHESAPDNSSVSAPMSAPVSAPVSAPISSRLGGRPTALDFMNVSDNTSTISASAISHSNRRSPSWSPPPIRTSGNIRYCDLIKNDDFSTLFLERFCNHGNKCINKRNHLKCSYNHSDRIVSTIIHKDECIPINVCKYEKPWIGTRCRDIRCTDWHLAGRVNFIKKIIQTNPDYLDTDDDEKNSKHKHDYDDNENYRKRKHEDDESMPKRPRLNTREVRTYLNIKRE